MTIWQLVRPIFLKSLAKGTECEEWRNENIISENALPIVASTLKKKQGGVVAKNLFYPTVIPFDRNY